jgi:alkylhydroperoxidase/carboxymuconolactone decarboxylase family protein YurZ
MDDLSAAWVDLPTEEFLRELLSDRSPYDFGFLPAMTRLVCAHPGIAPPFGSLFGTIMFGPGHMSRSEREMVAGVAAAAQDCFY